jgi:very-short-patch-repair endonuclease
VPGMRGGAEAGREAMKRRQTKSQILLALHLKELGVKTVPEHLFHLGRGFRFDLADLDAHIGYECDGGQFSGGHMRGRALEKQYEKDRLAQLGGWRVFRFTNRQILCGEAKAWLKEWL